MEAGRKSCRASGSLAAGPASCFTLNTRFVDPAHNNFQAGHNNSKAGRNKIKARRNKIKSWRNKIQTP